MADVNIEEEKKVEESQEETTQEELENTNDKSEETSTEELEEKGEAASESEETTETEEAEEKPPSRRESLRIQKLIEKLKTKDEGPAQPKGNAIDYSKMIDAEPEVLEQLNKASQEYGEQSYNRGLEQAKSIQFHTRLEIDAPKVESKYPLFNEESPEFNPVAAKAINEWYLATAGFNAQTGKVANADVRYADFVEGIMELADEMAGAKVAKTTKNIVKQAASTGLRPDGSSARRMDLSKAPEEMTNEELTAAISRSLPKK